KRLTDIPNNPNWGLLPNISRPYINRLCFHLRTDEDCEDLANLAQVSKHYYFGVNNFMKKEENRPGLRLVNISEAR
ncbi:hypothetical protein PMAYCL1PPCAC_27453, partial [Pristionchus mayeri]